jgi:hypothetical protein
MDWKGKMDAARAAGQAWQHKAEAAIEENWPKAQQLFQEKVGPAALAAAQDHKTMESLFKLVYSALPFAVRMAVKEDAFLNFCFGHRARLLPASSPKASPES